MRSLITSKAWAKLTRSGDGAKPVFIESSRFTIGRSSKCDLVLPKNRLISATHCCLECKNGKFVLVDCSTNGTKLNDKLLKCCEEVIQSGDVIQLAEPSDGVEGVFFTVEILEDEEDEEEEATVAIGGGVDAADDTMVTDDHISSPVSVRKTLDLKKRVATSPVSDSRKYCDPASPVAKRPRLQRVSDVINEEIARKPTDETQLLPDTESGATAPEEKSSDMGNARRVADDNSADAVGVNVDADEKSDPVVAAAGEETKPKPAPAPAQQDDMMEALTCSICCDIIHDCISLQPCLHSFCAGCYSVWMGKSRDCPQCRVKVKRICKNHIVNNIVGSYLGLHPEKKRGDEELKGLDKQNKITTDMLYPKKTSKRQKRGQQTNQVAQANDGDADEEEDDDDDDDDYNSSEDSDYRSISSVASTDEEDSPAQDGNAGGIFGVGFPVPGFGANLQGPGFGANLQGPGFGANLQGPGFGANVFAGANRFICTCRQCPGYANLVAGIPNPNAAGAANQAANGAGANVDQPPAYACTALTNHILCQCCMQPMPDRRAEARNGTIPTMECTRCHGIFCHMYWKCYVVGCTGCLAKFSDLQFTDAAMNTVLLGNTYESTILKDFLQANGKTVKDLHAECVEKLASKEYSGSSIQDPDTVICYKCGLLNLQHLAYQYRRDIPPDQLPAHVTARLNCHWGRNCRTQCHKGIHAQSFNHICEQTRFGQ